MQSGLNRARLSPLLLPLLMFLTVSVEALELHGKVLGVEDGDTFSLLDSLNGYYRIDIQDIDAPERAQPYGRRSKQYLESLVLGKQVKIVVDKDAFNRNNALEARVFVQSDATHASINVGHYVVATGHAFLRKSTLVDGRYKQLLGQAKEDERGQWSLPEFQRVHPVDWYTKASTDPRYTSSLKIDPKKDCDKKNRCVQMGSCSEAQFFLKQCYVTELDPDSDGIPCPELCKGRGIH